jgi:hypothetical protein
MEKTALGGEEDGPTLTPSRRAANQAPARCGYASWSKATSLGCCSAAYQKREKSTESQHFQHCRVASEVP